MHFDLVFTFEDRIFESVIEGKWATEANCNFLRSELQSRPIKLNRTTHIVNLTIKDNHEEAERGAELCADFCKRV